MLVVIRILGRERGFLGDCGRPPRGVDGVFEGDVMVMRFKHERFALVSGSKGGETGEVSGADKGELERLRLAIIVLGIRYGAAGCCAPI